MAACAGAAEVTERALIKTHKGKKTVSGEETIVLAKAPYSLAKGKTSTIKVTQTVAGMVAFADAKAHPRRERLVLSVRGGNTTNVSVLIS
jgi:hypothetical protein